MISGKVKIDFEKKKITINGCSMEELYAYLQDVFDEVENMRYDIPIEAIGPNKFKLINGWKLIK